jgi:tRNA-binding EMAP/Myf-like protein
LTQEHDYKSAIEWVESIPVKHPQQIEAKQAALHAIKLADKVTGEPSDGMLLSSADAGDCNSKREAITIFKAMIKAVQKEIEDDGSKRN